MNKILITFNDGPRVTIEGDDTSVQYDVKFINGETGELVYRTSLAAGHWAAASPRYYVPWNVKVSDGKNPELDYHFNLKGKDVLIAIDSKSLGDNVSWTPFVEEFRKKHECRVDLITFWNDLFANVYPHINFIEHNQTRGNAYYATYKLGAFDNDYNRNKNNMRLVPLQQIGSDILGFPRMEVQPRVKRSNQSRPMKERYVCISEFSTWYSKFWLYPNGWQTIVDWLNDKGYKVVSVSKEPTELKNVIKRNGLPIEAAIHYIQYADSFISVSTGLSVLAWALNIPVTIVSGCTGVGNEFEYAHRVVNQNVCHGCFADLKYPLDRGNWHLCPRSMNFICSRSITPDEVMAAITFREPSESVVEFVAKPKGQRVLFISPHCSTGGGPQFLLKEVEELQKVGVETAVVEYQNISDSYVVQKQRLRKLTPFYTLNGNKQTNLMKIMNEFDPGIIHLHEVPELFMSESAGALYSHKIKIVETHHGSSLPPKDKKFIPSAFAFVSPYQVDLYKDFCESRSVKSYLVEYDLGLPYRPERSQLLHRLGLNAEDYHVLHVGLFAPWKNQAEIFSIAKRLHNIHFHFVGNQAMNFTDYWKPLMDSKPDNCRVWGERDDVELFYQAMDLLIFPSTKEMNPLVVKEALYWNMPVLLRWLTTYGTTYHGNPKVTYIKDEATAERAVVRTLTPMAAKLLYEVYS